MDFLQIVMTPFSWLMKALYFLLFENYGLALIVFALLVKVLLFPLSLKGKKSMIQTTMLQGKMQQLQKQYGKDKNRYNEEVQKLYSKEGVNPMGGCLWSFIPLMILLPLYAVVRRPLRYLMGLSDTVVATVTATATGLGVALNQGYPEISIVSAFHGNPTVLEAAKTAINNPDLFGMNFNFLGIDLSATPTLKFWENGISWATIGLFLIPLISAVFSFLSSQIMMKTNAINNQTTQEGAAAQSNKMMMWMSPIMSLWIGFIMPAGMGIYWIANSIFSVVQEIICGKMLKKDYEKAAAARTQQEELEKEEEKRRKRAIAEERAQRAEEAKKNKGKKKPEEKKSIEGAKSPGGEASRVGLRAYARGRAYDPNRYGGATQYRDPAAPVDEAAIDAARHAKEDAAERAQEEAEIQAAADQALEQEALSAPLDPALEAEAEELGVDPDGPDTPDRDEPTFDQLPQETQELIEEGLAAEADEAIIESLTRAPHYDAPDYDKEDDEKKE